MKTNEDVTKALNAFSRSVATMETLIANPTFVALVNPTHDAFKIVKELREAHDLLNEHYFGVKCEKTGITVDFCQHCRDFKEGYEAALASLAKKSAYINNGKQKIVPNVKTVCAVCGSLEDDSETRVLYGKRTCGDCFVTEQETITANL